MHHGGDIILLRAGRACCFRKLVSVRIAYLRFEKNHFRKAYGVWLRLLLLKRPVAKQKAPIVECGLTSICRHSSINCRLTDC